MKDDSAIDDIREHLLKVQGHIGDMMLSAGDEMGPEVDSALKQLEDAAEELRRALDFIEDKEAGL